MGEATLAAVVSSLGLGVAVSDAIATYEFMQRYQAEMTCGVSGGRFRLTCREVVVDWICWTISCGAERDAG